jgi:hypothetical protein
VWILCGFGEDSVESVWNQCGLCVDPVWILY